MENKEIKPNNPRAFPATGYDEGMTLRDYFAAKVMAAMYVNVSAMNSNQYAKLAYAAADAMLKERSKSEE